MPQSLRGLATARERLRVLVWDEKDWLYLFDQNGNLQGQVQPPGRLAAASCADDGSAYAVCGSRGEVWWLKPDLTTAWQTAVPRGAVTLALDSFGQFLAVSDANGGLHVYDRDAATVFSVQSPRPFHHLAFVPSAPCLLACADYGVVGCFDMDGKWLWRDGLVAHIGALAVSGNGERILLACYSEGLQWYSLDGKRQVRQTAPDPCRLAAVSYEGGVILTAGLADRLQVLDLNGTSIGAYIVDSPAVALSLSALGDYASVALSDGTLLGLKLDYSETG